MKTFEKPLTCAEEKYYLQKCREGDQEARNKLIEKNMRLVAHIVKKYASPERDIEDLLSVGTIGLIKAVNTFDMDKSIRLATYAAKCIDNELLMLLRTDKRRNREMSIYEPIGKDKEGNETNLMEVIGASEDTVVEDYELRQNVKKLYESIENRLTPREREIIILRYGLYGNEEVTQREIASRMNISRSYVSRIEKRALEKMKIDFTNFT
ncbi:MAG: RNA polymerase sporulation sigma factor SigK [Clostridia bacterium]|nr:RNA polymerase sporulation sigma factor SigK [Clostridia bacterium]